MEIYYKCDKCGQMITKESGKSKMCVSDALMPARRICGGSFTVEISKDDVITQFKMWGLSQERIDEFLTNK